MNPSDPTIDQWIQEQHQEFVGPSLRMASVSKSRAAYLSDHRNVLRDLPNSGPGHWDLALATALHIGYADQYREEVLPNLVSEGRTHVYRLMTETEQNRPNLVLTPDQRPSGGSLSNRGRTYIYCRIALAIMIERDQPRFAIQLYESIATLFPRITSHHIAIEPYWLAPGLPLRRLVGLYETVGRYEEALRLSIPYIVSSPYEPDRGYEAAIRRFNGWIGQVLNSGGIAEVKRLLNSIQTVMQRVSVNDQESREQLSDCLPETRQYWAWFYGYILSQMILQKPRRRESLLDELAANEWSEGWPAGAMLVAATRGHWDDYREWCLRLYHATDLESRNNQPPVLANLPSADRPKQYDPQWATRVGFADAHIQSGQGESVTLKNIADTLKRIETITSSSAIRSLRSERKLDDIAEAIHKGVPPSDMYWRQKLKQDLAGIWELLPDAAIDHLVEACHHDYAKDFPNVCVALAKSIEALCRETVEPRIREGLGSTDLVLVVPYSERYPRRYRKDRWRMIPIAGWGAILNSISPDGHNSALGSELDLAFPDHDKDLVIGLHTDLERIAQLRGDSAHHPTRTGEQLADAAQELWSIVFGTERLDGFLARFCLAFGLKSGDRR